MIKYQKLGIFLSKPIALLFVLVYLLQAGFIVLLVQDKFDLEKQVDYQQKRILELEEKLKILKVIQDFQMGYTDKEQAEMAEVISSECKKYDYDPLFLISLILTESSFKPHQVSPMGAEGPMQIRPLTGRDLANKIGVDWRGSQTLEQPELNIKMGSLHLFELILKFKDVRTAIISYNLGGSELSRRMRLKEPLPRSYFEKVLRNYEMLKERYAT